MPAYTHLRTLINALKTGQTHITDCLDAHFSDPGHVRSDSHYGRFISEDWSNGPPEWLGPFLDSIGLEPEERDHVLRWPPAQLEAARAAAAAAAQAEQAIEFRWEIYHGDVPETQSMTRPAPRVLFRSPGSKLRLTKVNYGEIYVEDV